MNDDLKDWKSWLLFYEYIPDDDCVTYYHLVGYETIPSKEEIEEAIEEVKNDPEFGLGDKIYDLEYKILNEKDGYNIALQLREE